MNKISEKVKDVRGETLAEALLASLLAGIALLILASMIMVSHRMIDKSSETIEAFYGDINNIEKQEGPCNEGTVVIKSKNTPEKEIKIEVKIFKITDGSLAAYTK
ncbi:hypothetical protein [Clostridium sp. Marseille-P299]|uniref:hypothetical protein n=1 Tax=Clostridium sp. Marseille-P299 TaxID=1805477 RepID=UPI000830D1F3|nr:hypothetical protein [Clostridium sp. Marseille-P299]